MQTGPMRKAWSIDNHVCICGHHHSLEKHPERYRAEGADLTVSGDAVAAEQAEEEGEPAMDGVAEDGGAAEGTAADPGGDTGSGGGGGGEDHTGVGEVGGGATEGEEAQVSE